MTSSDRSERPHRPHRPELGRLAGRLLGGLLPIALLSAVGCGGPQADGDRSPAVLVQESHYAVTNEGAEQGSGDEPLRFDAVPRLETIALDDESRPAIVVPAEGGVSSWSWTVRVPDDGWLEVGAGLVPEANARTPGVPAAPAATSSSVEPQILGTVSVSRGSEREIVAVLRPDDPSEGAEAADGGSSAAGWVDAGADLSAWAGQKVTLRLSARLVEPPPPASATPAKRGWTSARQVRQLAWGPVALSSDRPDPALREAGKPNVLFILVDTMRRDHLTPYGYERETSPEIARRLATPGTVVEDAYSQAPWTLPSVISFMTSRYPGEILYGDPATFRIPDGVPSLAQVFSGLGYRTGGFIANPTLHASNGFAGGFDTFYSPSSMAAIQAHADSINRRALPWLRAHRADPFFLYVHYIDPHDPYMNSDVVHGRSRYFDDPGGLSGRWVHGVYTGKLPVEDMERTVRHFTALYDTEIHYVDRAIGELLASIPPEVLANTLVVLTADHGEELHDHGFWKHGHTLYQDQIHVPLIFRWDDRIQAGSRLHGTVRLIDVAPTLVAAAGGEVPPTWQGTDLLPALTGDGSLPRLSAFAQHLSSGPMRVASVLDGKKLILFNRREPFHATDGLQSHIYDVDMARLKRTELYDVDADPGEHHNLLARDGAPAGGDGSGASAAPPHAAAATTEPTEADEAQAEEVDRLDGIIRYHLHSVVRGLRAMADALPEGHRLHGELRFAQAPEEAIPLFLGPLDSLEIDGDRVVFDLVGEAVTKGFVLSGSPGALVEASLFLDGEPLPAGRLRVGGGTPFAGTAVEPDGFDSEAYPKPADRTGLRLWRYDGARPEDAEVDPETRKGLRALGYIQ